MATSTSKKSTKTLISLKDAAKVLRVPEQTLARWLRQGVLSTPIHYRQNKPYLEKQAFTRWTHAHRLSDFTPNTQASDCDHHPSTNLKTALSRGGVHCDLQGSCPKAIYQHLSNVLPIQPIDGSPLGTTPGQALLNNLIHRESLHSTAIGKQVALPHPAIPGPWGLGGYAACLVLLSKAVPWQADDGKPVRLLLAVFPTTTQEHLPLMSAAYALATSPAFLNLMQGKAHPTLKTLLTMITT